MINNDFLKLIVEDDMHDIEVITETVKTGGKIIKLKGPYIIADKVNGNKRSYEYKSLKPEVDHFVKNFVNKNRALGELEHPNYAHINPERSAIRITSLVEDNKTWIGESIVLASNPSQGIIGTPQGDILAALIQYNTSLGFSTRGVGKVHEGIVKDYKLCTIDCVANPSIGEFVEGILESKDFMINQHGAIVEATYETFENGLTKLTRNKNDQIFELLRNFLSGL
jgi:hypothetical protein